MSIVNKLPGVLPASLEVCEALMVQLSAECTSVRAQIESARAVVKTTGRYADADWFARANTALRWMNRDRQRLQDHMGKLRKATKVSQAQERDRLLIDALREHVSPEVFQACVDKARAIAGGGP